MKINILSPGRFHVCDLARELNANGFDVRFYSFVPNKRAMKFGLPKECACSVFFWILPFIALERLSHRKRWATNIRRKMQDFVTSIIMRKCDIIIAMTGNFEMSIKRAKKEGAVFIAERGSKHILEQKRILEETWKITNSNCTFDEVAVKRELWDYERADYISIASENVKRSFLKHSFPEDKLVLNPYGVDLSSFYPTNTKEKEFDVIMVGGWGVRKGCDLIVNALKDTNLKFLHVGGIVDLAFPELPNFSHIDPVEQKKLVEYYHKAKVFVLPSREDGFGMVLSQAVACNLPVVASIDTGGPDLKEMVKDPDCITIIDSYTPKSVKEAIDKAIEIADNMGDKIYAGDSLSKLTWQAYGERYAAFLNTLPCSNNH